MAALLLLAIVSVAGFGLAWRDQARLQQMNQDYAAQFKTAQQEHAQYTESTTALQQQLAKANETATALRSDVDVVTRRLRVTQGELTSARAEAAKSVEEANQQLEEMDTAVKSELATKASAEQLNTVTGDVTAVKADLDTSPRTICAWRAASWAR